MKTSKSQTGAGGSSLPRLVRARRKLDVWDRLARAYDRKGGLRLSPEDVDMLNYSDCPTAFCDRNARGLPAASGSLPSSAHARCIEILDGRLDNDAGFDPVELACESYVMAEDNLPPDDFDSEDYTLHGAVKSLVQKWEDYKALENENDNLRVAAHEFRGVSLNPNQTS